MIATIVRIEGNVQVQRADGSIENLAVGDQLFEGDVVLTENNSNVVLEYPNDEQVLVQGGASFAITREQLPDDSVDDLEFIADESSAEDILNVLDETDGDLLDQFQAPAAGNAAAGGDTGSNFVRLARVLETVYDTPVGLTPVEITGADITAAAAEQPDPGAVSSGTINLNAEYDQGGSGLTLSGTTTNLPPASTVSLLLTDSQGNQFTLTTTTNADGTYSVSGVDLTSLNDGNITIQASAVDATGETITDSDAVVVDETAGNLTVTSDVTDGNITVSGSSVDMAEGTEVSITIIDANGDTVTTTATVGADGNYTVDADVSGLVDGELTIDASATDNNGETVTETDTAELDNVAGDLTVNSSVTDGNITVSGTSTDMAEGTEVAITIEDENGDTVTTTATVGADGNYTVDADVSGLVDGELTIDASATDNNGETVTATDTAELDNVAGDLTVNSSVTDGNITVSGTSTDMAEGTEVAITIEDENGDTVTTTATVGADGNYTVDADVSGLVDGELTIDASATDNNGETVTATDTAELDNVAGDLTVASDVTDGNITVSGTSTDMAEGTEVAITIEDENGDTVTTTATVGADGNYTVDADVSGLVDGELTIDASATDNNGETVTATDTAELDNLAGDLTVTSDVTDGNITVSGSSVDMAEGTEVTITITDENGDTVTATAVVDANGNYSTNADISSLVDGDLTINAVAEDNNGTEQTASTTDELDNVDGSLSADASVTDGTVTVSGGSTDLPEGAEVAITITDANGDTVETTATVDANGDYTVDADVSGLVDGELTIDASATDNNGETVTATDTAELDNVAGDLTVTSDVTDGNITVSGTSTDMAEGTEVAITIIDANGDTVTATATVDADGNYTVDADISGLVDGDLTINAVADDNNGTELTASTTDELDNVDGSLSVESTVTDGNITVSGSSVDMAEGTEVTITITDENGDTVTTTATVGADGNYTVDADVSGLVDGELTIDASATDNNGETVTATDTAELDNVAGDLTVTSDVTDGNITVSGTSTDMAEGTEVVVTITDKNGTSVETTATIAADGTYTVDADISGLVDGDLTINAVANDNNGTEQTASTTDELDNVDGSLSADASVTDGTVTVSGGSTDLPEGAEVAITITDANGDIVETTATVDANGDYTVDADVSGLVDGELTIDASATDNNGETVTATDTAELDNVAGDLTVASDVTDGNITVSGTSTDMAEGTEVAITIEDENGDTVTTTATVGADGNYTVDADISGLVDGELTINAVANDNNGTEQSASTTDELDNVDGSLSADATVTDGTVTVSGGSTDLPEGAEVAITITDANGDTVETTATVDANGDYTVDADVSGLVDGELTIDASATDNNGETVTATDTAELDNLAGDLTVTSDVTDGNITVSGSSVDMAEGTEVTITITDENGDTVTATAVVDANGNYSTNADISSLVDGDLTINAVAEDNNGTEQTASTTDELDNVAGDLTVTSDVTDGNITVSGSSVDMAEGTEVTITITDENGDTVTATAVVDANGNYSTNADISSLVDGDLTINAVADDNNGTEQTASTNDELDNVAGDLTVTSDVTDGNITVSGTSTDMAEGTEVTITIEDENGDTVTTTATVGADGNYTVDADISGLVDGDLTINAVAEDNNGTEQTASTTDELDNVDGSLSVESTVTDGNITVSGSSVDMAEGTEVTITITDENGDTVTTTATVGADGNYTVDADISGLVDGELTINAVANDNNGTEQSASTTDELDNVDGSLSADATVTDGTVTVSGGSTDLPEGAEVAITITDANGDIVETTATVDANGDYTVDADVSGLVDGELTIDASATDNNGETVTATDTAELDNVAGDLTVTSDVTDGNITVSGTSTDMAEGTEVAITIIDANGNTVTATAVVDGNGDYSTNTDISGLVDGDLTINAVANDNNGTEQTASTTDELDNVAGDLTVASDVTDGNITVSGTSTDMAEGTEVAITIIDANGDTVTATATVDADGNYTVDADISGLVDGDLTINAVADDNNGTEQTASTNDELDNVAGDLTVTSDVTDGNITVSGTSTDMAEGTEVTITIEDENGDTVTTTATVGADGNYTVDADVSGLVDGELTIDASATDNNGETVTATDTAELDNVAGDLTVTSDVTDGNITVSGTSTDMAEGTEVVVTITDKNGTSVETTATIAADGTYTVDADISGLVDGDLTINAVANDNNGTEQTASTTDELDNVDGSLSADASVTDGTVTVSGGSTDLPEGAEVAITITDANGDIVETTATVDANGDYTVDADVSGLVDGELTIDASATDNNGETVTATDTAELDNVAGDLTVASDVTDGNITVSGTSTDMAEGTDVTITIEDENGDTVTTTATVGADGNYTVDADISGLVDGDLTINAVAEDNNGTEQTASTNDELDTTAPGDGGDSNNSIAFGDELINSDEQSDIGFTGQVEDGATVNSIVISDGQGGSVTVDANDITVSGNDVSVAGQDLSDLADGELTVTMTVTDAAGNEGSVTDNATLDTSADAGTVSVNNITGDDVLNAQESNETITVSGSASGGDIAEGDTVAMTINGEEYSTTVDADGNWSVDVEGSDLAADTEFEVVVSSTDAAGNTVDSTATSTHTVDTSAPGDGGDSNNSIAFGDELINDSEQSNIGFTGQVEDGATVNSIVITDGTTEIVVAESDISVDDNGNVTVIGQDLSTLTDGELTVTMTVTDAAGNEGSVDDTATLDTAAEGGTVSVNNITGDDVLNAQEAGETITVSGSASGGDIAEGDTVAMTINGEEYSTTVDADGNWSVDVEGSDLAADTEFEVVVSSTDAAGNTVDSTATSTHTVDINIPNPPVITNITDDSSDSDYSDVTMHGTGEPGETISIYFEGETGIPLAQATVGTDGSWTVALEDIASIGINDNVRLEAVQSDDAGNQSEPSGAVHYWHGEWTNANTEAGDDYVLSGEGNDTVNIITDDINDQLVIDGGAGNDKAVFNTSVDNLSFSKDSNGYVIVENSDTGDRVELRDFELINVDGDDKNIDELFTPTVDIVEDANNDGVISSDELDGQVDVEVGLPAGAVDGDTIRVSDGTTTNEIVLAQSDIDNGSVATSFDAPGEGETLEVTAVLEDQFGNTSEEGSDTARLDTAAEEGTVSVNNITGDDVINAQEAGETITVSGSANGGDIAEGDTVAMTINGEEYSTTVDADGNWSVDVEGSDLAADTEFEVVVSSTDAAGNTVDSTATSTHTVDITAPTLTINAPDTNDTTPILSGTSDEIGATISVTVTDANNQTQTLTAVVAADGSWALDVADELAEGTYTVQASVEDDAGNEAVANTQGEIDLTAPTLTLEVPTNVNDTTPTISGTSDEIGGTVYLVVTDADGNEQQLEATVDNNGNWQVDTEIPLAVGEYTVSATISDDVGNQAQTSQSQGVIEPSVVIVDFELNSEVGIDVTDSIWSGGVSNNQFGIVSNYSVNQNNPNQSVDSDRINDRGTRNLEITSDEGSNETYLFAVGDTYSVSYEQYVGWGPFGYWQTIELEMTVTRSDVQGFNGEDTDILVLTGTLPSGEDVTLVMASGEIDNFNGFYVNDQFDTDVGFREFTVNGEAASNSTVIIEQVDENGNVIDSATVTSDANGQWSYDVGQLEGRSGILKVTSVDQYGNESVDEKNFLFGETNNENTLEGSDSSDLIVGGLEDDSITGGQDSDVLIGGDGNDTFVWKADDEGTVNIPEADTIQDFALGNFASDDEADRLDLSDLLQGESTSTIDNYLYAEDDGNGNTVLHINSEGNLSGTDNADQVVTLQDVQMADGQSSSDFIQQMLNDGQLLIDSGSSASTQSSSEGTSIDLQQINKSSGVE
jgi:copper(I)-binding protein